MHQQQVQRERLVEKVMIPLFSILLNAQLIASRATLGWPSTSFLGDLRFLSLAITHQVIGSWKVYSKNLYSILHCKYHQSHGHSTDKCTRLCHEIEDLIQSGKVPLPSINLQTSRLILFPTTMACLILVGINWSRSLVFVIASTRVFLSRCVFQSRSVVSIQCVFAVSIKWVFQFMYSFNSSIKWFAMIWVLW